MIDEKKLAALQYNSDVLGAIGRAFAEASEGVPGDQLDDCVRALIGEVQRLRAVADAARAWRDAIGREDATATAWLAARDCGSQDDGSRAPYEAACADVQRHRAALDAALAALDAALAALDAGGGA